MKKLFTSIALGMMTLVGAFTANAADVITSGQAFTATMGEVYQFTPGGSGTATVVFTSGSNIDDENMIYSDVTCSSPLSMNYVNSNTFTCTVAASTTYYFQFKRGMLAFDDPQSPQQVTITFPTEESSSQPGTDGDGDGVTLTGVGQNTPIPGSLMKNTSTYDWWFTSFTYTLTNPEGLTINIGNATVNFTYTVEGSEPVTKAGTVTYFSTTELIATTGNDEDFSNWLNAAVSAGAGKWQIVFDGVTVGTDKEPIGSGCKGVASEDGKLIITYYLTEEALEEDGGEGGPGGNEAPESWESATWETPFTAPTEGANWIIPLLSTAPDGEYNGFYFMTNSSTDLTENNNYFIFQSQENWNTPITSITTVEDPDGNFVYNVSGNFWFGANPVLIYNGDPITFTLYPGTYENTADKVYVTENETFDMNENETVYFIAPSGDPQQIYFVSNSEVDYSEQLIFSTTGAYPMPLDWKTVKTTSDGFYYYILGEKINNSTYSLTYTGSAPIKLTLHIGEYSEGGDTPEAQVIEPTEPFEVEAEGEYSSGHPLWVYTPEEKIDNYYFTVNDYGYNVFEGLDSDSPALVVFSTDPEGNDKINLTAVNAPKGEYVYTGENLEANQNYYIVFIGGEYDYLNMTLYITEYVPEGGTQNGQIELGVDFTPDSATPTYEYNATSNIDHVCLYTTSNVNILETGSLTMTSMGVDLDWTPVLTADGWAYNGSITSGATYLFTYDGAESVTFTLKSGSATADPLDNPSLVYDKANSKVYLVFTEEIFKVGDTIDGYITYPNMSADDNNDFVDGTIVTYDPESTGLSNNAIEFDVASTIESHKAGIYTLVVYSAAVRNANYQENSSISESFTVESTGVDSIGAAIEEGAVIYNLQGQKVSNPAKGGIYIINGKKVLVK